VTVIGVLGAWIAQADDQCQTTGRRSIPRCLAINRAG